MENDVQLSASKIETDDLFKISCFHQVNKSSGSIKLTNIN